MATRMQQRRGTADQWLSADPVLDIGEIGFETDTNSFKIGDGVNSWVLLDYFTNESGLSASLEDYILATEKAAANGVATLDANGFVPAEQLDIDLTAYYTSAEVDAEIAAIPAPDYTGLATETYADTAAANAAAAIVDSSPAALDTLNELAAALGDDANFATTVTDALAGKAATSHTHTVSNITDLTATATELNYVDGVTSSVQGQLDGKAPTSHTHNITEISQDVVTLTVTQVVTALPSGLENKLVIVKHAGSNSSFDTLLDLANYTGTAGKFITFALPAPGDPDRPAFLEVYNSSGGSTGTEIFTSGSIGADDTRRIFLSTMDNAAAATLTFITPNMAYWLGNLRTLSEVESA